VGVGGALFPRGAGKIMIKDLWVINSSMLGQDRFDLSHLVPGMTPGNEYEKNVFGPAVSTLSPVGPAFTYMGRS
jgi:hypothetical protein